MRENVNNERGWKVHMRLKHRESPHEIISQLDGRVSIILSEGCLWCFYSKWVWKFSYTRKQYGGKSSVSSMYVDEFENMSDSESATLDLENNSS